MPKKKFGFTLLEVVVSIVLFTILSCFIMAIVPPLIVKFRASAFKEQTIYLAKNKLEEYLYATPAEQAGYDSGAQRFAFPNQQFWYRVTLASYGSNTNTNLVTVNVWGPTADGNRTNINPAALIGLAKAASSTRIVQMRLTVDGLSNFYVLPRFSGLTSKYNFKGQISPSGLVYNIYGGVYGARDYYGAIFWRFGGNPNPTGFTFDTCALFFGDRSQQFSSSNPLSPYYLLQGKGENTSVSSQYFYRIWGLAFGSGHALYVSVTPKTGTSPNTTMTDLINLDGRMQTLEYARDNNPEFIASYIAEFRELQTRIKNGEALIRNYIIQTIPWTGGKSNTGFEDIHSSNARILNITNGTGEIAVDSQSNIYSIDLAGTAVRKHRSNGALIRELDKTKYEYAEKVRTDSAGNSYVYDRLNSKIVIFNADGTYNKTLNSSDLNIPGVSNFQIRDFAVDADGNIFVINRPLYNSDRTLSVSDKIYQIDSNGRHINTSQSTQLSGTDMFPIKTIMSIDCTKSFFKYLVCSGLYSDGRTERISTQVYRMWTQAR